MYRLCRPGARQRAVLFASLRRECQNSGLMRIGVDAGGTFTDFIVLHDNGRMENFKIRSNPRAPHLVILEGLNRAASGVTADVVHGSTVATNALLERKGARTAFVTTEGFCDLLLIGRQNRAELYNLAPVPRTPLVPRELCFTVKERTFFDGTIEWAPHAAELRKLKKRLKRAGVESVALCFLHSYRNPENEKLAEQLLDWDGSFCASHSICPEFREYERASTTVLNAYVGPLMDSYIGRLREGCRHRISILQSNGGFMTAEEARRHPVRTVLSGPAGGVGGAVAAARASGYRKILGFDMGGTSTDVCLCDGKPTESTEAYVDGFPVRVPMLDIHTVGAGGGSIARVDEGGLLRVGPESAGADPGPACYGTGDEPTVTDAHVVLGRIEANQFLGGTMSLDPDRAGRAVDRVAAKLGLDRTAAAEGILRVANANMQRAIRVVSVERGHDPREFALVAFGGCGGLHGCEVAEELAIPSVLVPRDAGSLSALGMLLADHKRDFSAGVLGSPSVEQAFAALERQARKELRGARLQRWVDVRYAGQSYELTVPWTRGGLAARFHREHQRIYGYSNPSRSLEIVTARVRAVRGVKRPSLRFKPARDTAAPQLRRMYLSGRWRKVPVFYRGQVGTEEQDGPALVLDYGATSLVPRGWTFRRDSADNLVLHRLGVHPGLI
jgi:N-methylhydantoinase A